MKLGNLDLRRYRRFLLRCGCEERRTKGGHVIYSFLDPDSGIRHPIVLQTHVDPVPERIVRQHLRCLGLTREQFARKWRQC